ncbi:MAG: type II secretion system F family protein [Schwartzia sp.]|nr:type II secretion system F family protein [Schwartzia sp. (in: firmicutes)]
MMHQDTVMAPTERDAAAAVLQRGLFLVRLRKPSIGDQVRHYLQDRIGRHDQMVFFRQLSVMVLAGMTLSECLRVLAEQDAPPALKRVVRALYARVQGGSSLSDAMKRQGDVFPRLAVYLVGAGELSGSLDIVLSRLADYLEEQYVSRTKLITMMLYPMVLLMAVIVAVAFLLSYVLPVFAGLFASLEANLPWPTRLLLQFHRLWQESGPGLILLAAIAVALLGVVCRRDAGRARLDRWLLRLPVMGPMLVYTELMHFSGTLSVLLSSGIVIDQALTVLQDTTANAHIRRELLRVKHDVERGLTMSASLRQSRLFPPVLLELLATGERTGEMDRVLAKISDFCRLEAATRTERLRSLMEPAMLLVMGGIIGFIVFAIALPVLDAMTLYS